MMTKFTNNSWTRVLNIFSRIGAGPNHECVGTEWNRTKVKGPKQSMQWVRDSGQRKGLDCDDDPESIMQAMESGIRAQEGLGRNDPISYPECKQWAWASE